MEGSFRHRRAVSTTTGGDKVSACTAGSSAFCFYCDPDFMYSHLGRFPDCASGTAGTGPRTGQSRDGSGPARSPFRRLGGERTRLLERGVNFDFQYVSDSVWNLKSEQKERFASWNRFRGTVDIDFGALTGQHGFYFHATALWQGGGDLETYLGLLTSPSGMSSANTCRLDSW